MPDASTVSVLALGDSYTICTGATTPATRWPDLVGRHLTRGGTRAVDVVNLGVDGWTTQQVIDHQLPHLGDRPWDLVTILAGVNDEYQGVHAAVYRARIELVHDVIAAHRPGAVLALSIPDYSVTPVGRAAKSPGETVARVLEFNGIARRSSQRHGFTWVDLIEVSRRGGGEPAWVSPDGLHPSDAQYATWADLVVSSLPPGT